MLPDFFSNKNLVYIYCPSLKFSDFNILLSQIGKTSFELTSCEFFISSLDKKITEKLHEINFTFYKPEDYNLCDNNFNYFITTTRDSKNLNRKNSKKIFFLNESSFSFKVSPILIGSFL